MTSDKKHVAGLAKYINEKALIPHCPPQGWSNAYAGNATVNGLKAVKIQETARHESHIQYIENGPTPYILRMTGSEKDAGDFVFSDYGVQPDTSAPPGAVLHHPVLSRSPRLGKTAA